MTTPGAGSHLYERWMNPLPEVAAWECRWCGNDYTDPRHAAYIADRELLEAKLAADKRLREAAPALLEALIAVNAEMKALGYGSCYETDQADDAIALARPKIVTPISK